jgi:hypothetical protein
MQPGRQSSAELLRRVSPAAWTSYYSIECGYGMLMPVVPGVIIFRVGLDLVVSVLVSAASRCAALCWCID